jgi:hypothetical protein
LVSINSFRTATLPDCLNDDWWEIEDWAKFYEYLTGSLPNAQLQAYWTEYTLLDVNKYFPPGDIWYTWEYHPVFIIDIKADGTYKNLGHNPGPYNASNIADKMLIPNTGCYHTYSTLLYNKTHYGYSTYFYKPQIPLDAYTQEVKDKLAAMKDFVVCDWREIIYQMALDYF